MQQKNEAAWQAILDKIRERTALPGHTQVSVATALGVDKATVGRWLKAKRKGTQKTIDELVKYMMVLGINPAHYLGSQGAGASKKIPLIGMAACGYEWCREIKTAVSMVAAPPGDDAQELFAVMASGESMRPAGIEEGFVIFCDPTQLPEKDDAIFVERENGTMSLKMFRGTEGIWTILEGWLPPDAQGTQQIYTLREHTSSLVKVAPVIYVKRKP